MKDVRKEEGLQVEEKRRNREVRDSQEWMHKKGLKKEGEIEVMAGFKGARTGGNRGQEFMKQPEKDT